MAEEQTEQDGEMEALEALAPIRSRALTRLFPGTVAGIHDASAEVLPRIIGQEVAYRSRLLEELATMQLLLLQEALRPLKERAPASLPAIVREMRGLIRDQLKLVKEAPVGTGADAAKHQAADLLQRRAYLMAEIRRRGLESFLASGGAQDERTAGSTPKDPQLAAIVALAGAGAAGNALELEAGATVDARDAQVDAAGTAAEGYRDQQA